MKGGNELSPTAGGHEGDLSELDCYCGEVSGLLNRTSSWEGTSVQYTFFLK